MKAHFTKGNLCNANMHMKIWSASLHNKEIQSEVTMGQPCTPIRVSKRKIVITPSVVEVVLGLHAYVYIYKMARLFWKIVHNFLQTRHPPIIHTLKILSWKMKTHFFIGTDP